MNYGRMLYQLARVYVWVLVLLAIGTVGQIAVPRIAPTATVAGLWFAVAGFGSLVMLTAVMMYLLN
jgi:hypothetical protein